MAVICAVLLLFAAFIGFLMESYKKCIRDDKAGKWEIRLVAFILSLLYGFITWCFTNPDALPEAVRFTPWLIAPYTTAIYLLQLPACMKVWKPLLKRYLEGKVDG